MAFEVHPEAELIHEGVRVTLKRATFQKADGGEAEREVVEAADAVVVLPLLEGGRVILIRNRRFAVKQRLWELPAGTVEAGEDLAACAKRELQEETGYAAARIEPMTSFWPTPGFCTEKLHAFTATGLETGEQDLDETEDIEVAVKPMREVLDMVRDGAIEDAKTIAALLYFEVFLRQTAPRFEGVEPEGSGD
jgi:ADP-ribose pyrophosphatase